MANHIKLKHFEFWQPNYVTFEFIEKKVKEKHPKATKIEIDYLKYESNGYTYNIKFVED